MLQRIKKAYKAFKDEELTPEDKELYAVKGDGNAVFYAEGTEQEYEEYLDEERGWKGFLSKHKLWG